MAVIRRHWVFSLIVATLLVAGGVWLATWQLRPVIAEETPAEEPSNTLDPATYCAVRELRQRLCLRNGDVAAMGCTQEQAETVLQKLLDWYEANKAALATARNAVGQARRALRHAYAKMHAGPRDEGLLANIPNLKNSLAQASASETAAVAAAIPAMEAHLQTSQKTTWAIVRANKAAPFQYRYAPSLSAQQLKTLHVARRTRARKLAGARTATAMTAAETALVTAETNALTATQKTAMAAAKVNLRAKMPGVLAASQKVLPMPEELQPPVAPLPGEPEPTQTP